MTPTERICGQCGSTKRYRMGMCGKCYDRERRAKAPHIPCTQCGVICPRRTVEHNLCSPCRHAKSAQARRIYDITCPTCGEFRQHKRNGLCGPCYYRSRHPLSTRPPLTAEVLAESDWVIVERLKAGRADVHPLRVDLLAATRDMSNQGVARSVIAERLRCNIKNVDYMRKQLQRAGLLK